MGKGGKGNGQVYAHRVSWGLHNGPIPEGMWVLHRCDNPSCVNPTHLFLGTQADNVADMISKGRQATPEQTAHIGEKNGRARLTPDQVRTIRTLVAGGVSETEAARRYGVGQTTVSYIVLRKSWKHI
jgi:predicted DNA-binding protein (UPF0251 family)